MGYEENRGLCYALDYGLRFCDNEWVFRMDSPKAIRRVLTYARQGY